MLPSQGCPYGPFQDILKPSVARTKEKRIKEKESINARRYFTQLKSTAKLDFFSTIPTLTK